MVRSADRTRACQSIQIFLSKTHTDYCRVLWTHGLFALITLNKLSGIVHMLEILIFLALLFSLSLSKSPSFLPSFLGIKTPSLTLLFSKFALSIFLSISPASPLSPLSLSIYWHLDTRMEDADRDRSCSYNRRQKIKMETLNILFDILVSITWW